MALVVGDVKLQPNHRGDPSTGPDLPSKAIGFGAMAWLVAAWRCRQTQIKLIENPRIQNSKSVWNSRSCTISCSPPRSVKRRDATCISGN